MSDLDLDERYFLIAYIATKLAPTGVHPDGPYETGFENRMHYFEKIEEEG